MKIETKYSCGDKVFKIQQEMEKIFKTCGWCGGNKRIMGRDNNERMCPECYGSGGKTEYGVKKWFVVGELTIGQVRFEYTGKSKGYDPDSMFSNYGPQSEKHKEEYMCQETGVGSGSVHYVKTLFPTRESAQAECNIKNKAIEEDDDPEIT